MEQLNNAFTLFLSLLVEALPFLLLGVLLSSILLICIDERWLLARMPKNPLLGAFTGSCIGFLFPVCECGNVPVARRLIMQGIPMPVAIGFLLAAPTVNPIVIWSTWIAFRDRPEIVVLRVVFSLLIATIIGYIFSVQKDLKPILQPAIAMGTLRAEPKVSTGYSILDGGDFMLGSRGMAPQRMTPELIQPPKRSFRANLNLVLDNVIQELRELGGVLILGSAVAAAIQTLTPRELIVSLGEGPIISIVVMMILAGSISICSTVDSFFALSFAATFTSGSLLAFLVFGPMFDLKSIGLMLSIFKPKAIIYLFAIATQLTFLFTLFVNFHVS
ncbi:permease [Chamaesiphon minutus]|uniref:Putative permease n=1 Tax=Chamaesiphon minutus (strain ATCC 27169 / PCC 6605) TaxID=1173020 RepID=K9UJE1_CHAP6|nr:permease [Chamaesiphon minutus]AFY94299.1 putative permease [Chamaesiphon minutus PCC 6605]